MEQEPKIEIHQHQNKTWYNLAEGFDKWRVFPRLLITLYGYAFYKTTEWFMTLPDPTNAQSAFVSQSRSYAVHSMRVFSLMSVVI
jgi:hypothetical protein